MRVSIIIPCYNERITIEKIVHAVRSAAIESKEIIVVDDCSDDGTQAVLEDRVSPMVDRIIYHPVNRGNGVALRSAFDAATGDIIVVQDADLEYNPDDYYSDNRRSRRCFQFPVSEWPTRARCCPVATSQICTIPWSPAEATRFPSGL